VLSFNKIPPQIEEITSLEHVDTVC